MRIRPPCSSNSDDADEKNVRYPRPYPDMEKWAKHWLQSLHSSLPTPEGSGIKVVFSYRSISSRSSYHNLRSFTNTVA